MKLGIAARDDDAQADQLADVARTRGHDVERLCFQSLLGGTPARFDGAAWSLGAVALCACDAVVVRQLPAPTAQLAPSDEVASAAVWYRSGKKQEERATFAYSALADLELGGVPMVNPVVASWPYDHKPLQLAALLRAGLPVPPTLITNDAGAACAFDDAWRAAGRETIVKPAAGGAAALLVDDIVRAQLHAHTSAPAIFQRRARGRDVRVTVVGTAVVSSVVMEGERGDIVDFRADPSWQRGAGVVTSYPLPPRIAALSVRAAGVCHQVLSGLDWKHDQEHDTWELLEANSAPVTLGIEAQTGAPISAAVVRWLEDAVERRARTSS